MRKKGFTLAEALIALGIVGIVAALALPMFNKTKPDPIKVAYLKTYDSIVSTTRTLTKNQKLYPTQNTTLTNGIDRFSRFNSEAIFYDYPLFNLMKGKDVTTGVDLNEGKIKLCNAFFYSFDGETNSCKEDPIAEYKDENFKPSFSTKNGTEFMISTRVENIANSDTEPYRAGLYETSIFFDVNGAKGNNCIYNKNTCTSPDRFKVFVVADGRVIPADAMGKGYLKTRNLLNKISMLGKLQDPDVDINAGTAALINQDEYCGTEGVLNGQECEPCDEGQYVVDGVCQPIPCEEGVVENGFCIPCTDKGMVWDGANGCIPCPTGYYIDGGGCRPCEGNVNANGGCDTCASQGKEWTGSGCKACTAPRILKAGKCACPKYEDAGECIDCDPALRNQIYYTTEQWTNGHFGPPACINGKWEKTCDSGYTYNSSLDACLKPGSEFWTGFVKFNIVVTDTYGIYGSSIVRDYQIDITPADRISKDDYESQIYHEIIMLRFSKELEPYEGGRYEASIADVQYYYVGNDDAP